MGLCSSRVSLRIHLASIVKCLCLELKHQGAISTHGVPSLPRVVFCRRLTRLAATAKGALAKADGGAGGRHCVRDGLRRL